MINVIYIYEIRVRISRVRFPVTPVVPPIESAMIPGVRITHGVRVIRVYEVIMIHSISCTTNVDPILRIVHNGVTKDDVILSMRPKIHTAAGIIRNHVPLNQEIICIIVEIDSMPPVIRNQIPLDRVLSIGAFIEEETIFIMSNTIICDDVTFVLREFYTIRRSICDPVLSNNDSTRIFFKSYSSLYN